MMDKIWDEKIEQLRAALLDAKGALEIVDNPEDNSKSGLSIVRRGKYTVGGIIEAALSETI